MTPPPPLEDDPGSGVGTDDAAEPALDLSPRTGPGDDVRSPGARARRPRRRTNPLLIVLLVAIVGAVGYVVLNGLSGATLYFRNADEAVAERDELGTRRFRLQGLVVTEPDPNDDVAAFEVAFDGVKVAVRSTDGIPALFELGRPVVMEGHFAEGEEILFLADRILVKHDESYEADNSERIDDAGDGESEE